MKEVKILESPLSPLDQIQTPYDDMLPHVEEPSARFYLDAMRIYLALSAGTLSFDDAINATELLKANPEFARSPTNPTQVPINSYYINKVLDNLKTLKKFNLATRDSIRSAYSFAFIEPGTPINKVDLETLSVLVQNPRSSITNLGKELNLAPRTISRSITRLRERHDVRFRALLDYTLWAANTILVFFTPRNDIDWNAIEDQLIKYPFIKTMIKTTMTNLGYLSIIVPGGQNNLRAFLDSVRNLADTYFEYVSIHQEISTGVARNLSLYKNEVWHFATSAKLTLEDLNIPPPDAALVEVKCHGPQNVFTQQDFEIATIAKLDSRSMPSDIIPFLERRNLDVDSKKIANVVRKLYNRGVMKPYVTFNLGLSSSFCFEIECNLEWRERIKNVIPLLPFTTFLESPRGIIVWCSVPGSQQVEYYQMFRALEQQIGVKSVQSLMTISQMGSRSILDLVSKWKYTKNGYTVQPEELDINRYISDLN